MAHNYLLYLAFIALAVSLVENSENHGSICRRINNKEYFKVSGHLKQCTNVTCPVCTDSSSNCPPPLHVDCHNCCYATSIEPRHNSTSSRHLTPVKALFDRLKSVNAERIVSEESSSQKDMLEEIKLLHILYGCTIVVILVGAIIIIHKQARAITKLKEKYYL